MSYYKKKHILFFILCILSITMLLPTQSYAIDRFFNGEKTTLTDINQPNDRFFGGSNSQPPYSVIGGTDLTLTTQSLGQNIIEAAYGGSLAQNNSSVINGDVKLTVNNTLAQQISGGSLSIGVGGGDTFILGSIYLDIRNSTVNGLIRGAGFSNAGALVSGSLNMYLNNVTCNGNVVGIAGANRGLGNQGAVVNGDINMTIENSNITGEISIGSNNHNIPIVGNATLTLINTTVDRDVIGGWNSDIYGNLTMNFLNNTNVRRDTILSIGGNVYGKALINVKKSTLSRLFLAPDNQGFSAQMAIANIEESSINLLRLGSFESGTLIHGVANILKGSTIQSLELGSQDNSITNYAEANIHGGEVVRLVLGSNDVVAPAAHTGTAIVNIYGGTVNDISILAADSTTINLMKGTKSHITGGIRSGNANNHVLDTLNIHKHAETHWGTSGNLFLAEAKNVTLSGALFYPASENSEVALSISEKLIIDGGFVVPENLMPTADAPALVFTNIAGSIPTLTINKPLTIVLSYSPQLLGANNIPVAFVVPEFYSPNFFEKHNTTGIIWSDSVFDETTGVWSVTNIRPSEDYYGISAAREASNWLRQQHILSVQNRASMTLTSKSKNKSGLWLDVQGGYEKLDSKVGKSKMPWTMATLGYDYLQKFNDVKALYGLNFSFSRGNNKWKSVNRTKNNIIMGIVNAYIGLEHVSGVYGTATAQYTASKIKSKSSGFTSSSYKWTENIPTEALELGWNFSLAEGLSITPRGQVIFEQLSKHTFKLSQDNDKATLKKSTVITTVAGIHAEYDLVTNSLPISIEAGVDWIQGVSGDFAANSRTLDLTFKDKNDSSVIRTSLSINTQITEDIHCSLSGFIDAGHDKGAGGQLNATYKF